MKLTKEERTKLTYEIGDIIEQKCRRCYYNRSDDACFSISVCGNCPTGQELRRLGRYLDPTPKKRGRQMRTPTGLTPERVRELNLQGIADRTIGIMYDRSPNYVNKLKQRWKKQGLWEGPTNMWKIRKGKGNA
ncbi:hypothetical protein ACE41A_13340 [Bacillus cytotoxicus]|uniref:hypothetical protein n=1 Tax=Bacillus cytotoxicus TaxID=580165 RepID=UPI0035CC0D4A